MAKRVIVITGPTATGKTALGIELADRLDGEVVSADSMQVYKLMDIGTAKPTPEECRGIPHHMLSVVSPFESYSAARYVEEASQCVDNIISRGKTPIIVGGTGLYIDSLLSGRDFSDRADPLLRVELEREYDAIGGEQMLKKLSEADREAAQRLHPNDKKRIVRALEVYRSTGKTISEHNAETQKAPPKYEACKLALNFSDRQELYDRIDRRVDTMIEQGLLGEVRKLIQLGLDSGYTSMQAIGYKELALYIEGKVSLEVAVEKIKQESRRYAKRQLSWFRRDGQIKWIIWEKTPEIRAGLQKSAKYLRELDYNLPV